MATSPSHRFGQIIGEVLEAAIIPLLADFAAKHGLYFDKKGPRPCRSGLKCSWTDLNKNSHDLDFVLERGGTPTKKGMPAAFIEVAWRSYTKHSRNKAQEIQGAIMPLAETYSANGPFKGAILAGVFTAGAITQLTSLGFTILYFPYESVVGVFRKLGMDAAFDEQTADKDLARKVKAYKGLSVADKQRLPKELLAAHKQDIDKFIASLSTAVSKQIDRIIILPLHGDYRELATIEDAIRYIGEHGETAGKIFIRYEIQIRYNNGDNINGAFENKDTAIKFLKTFQPVVP
ncbi:MAG TPA: DNA methylase [Verrucomicrobiae bacterium]|jgi:hypothetical protein